jgi:RNA polymerase sigma-70 factor (ECF subfamily)
MAGANTVGNIAGALGISAEEAAIVSDLKAGSEDAYAWLIARFQQPVFSLVVRILNEPADAADTTQEVFLKIFKGIQRFNGSSSLRTWVYRIALHEASNRRRWWSRHKSRETSIQRTDNHELSIGQVSLDEMLVDPGKSPFERMVNGELKALVEAELKLVAEPFRTTILLRDIEELSYEEIAEVMEVSLGTVKSRVTRGREALKKRLEKHLPELGPEFTLPPRERSTAASPDGLTSAVEVIL